MATRANIVVQTGPQEFSVIYTHNDGYPSWMGVTLNRFHNSDEEARRIVAEGGLSCLYPRFGPEPGEVHSFDKRAPFCSVFYMRDRGEKGVEARTYDTLSEAVANCDNEWVYVRLQGADDWLFAEVELRAPNEPSGDWMVMTDVANLLPVGPFAATDEECQQRIAEWDASGMTVAWRDAGCPHSVVAGKYDDHHFAVPLNDDGSIPETFDHGVIHPGTSWEREVGVLPVYTVGAPMIEAAPSSPKRKVAKKSDKRGFFYEQEGTL